MIYLDNAATTRMDPEVVEVMEKSLRDDFVNSGAVYGPGLDARKKIETCQEEMASLLKLPSTHRIVFTSGGSESNNLFIKGLCFPDRKAACLGLEHPSITTTLESFREFGNDPVYLLPYQHNGRLGSEAFDVLREQRVRLLCLSHVNNELGIMQDIPTLADALKRNSPRTALFVDGVQAVGKYVFAPGFWNSVSGYSISAHKFHGPKGIGALLLEKRLDLKPQIHGGQQQEGTRSGTLPLPLIVGMTHALKLAVKRTDETLVHCRKLFLHLVEGLRGLKTSRPDFNLKFNSLVENSESGQSPLICNFSFPPVEGEVVLHHLEAQGIYVGLGSACSAHSREPSKILLGLGCSPEEALCSLRVSFSRDNTLEELDRFLLSFAEAYDALYPTFRAKAAH